MSHIWTSLWLPLPKVVHLTLVLHFVSSSQSSFQIINWLSVGFPTGKRCADVSHAESGPSLSSSLLCPQLLVFGRHLKNLQWKTETKLWSAWKLHMPDSNQFIYWALSLSLFLFLFLSPFPLPLTSSDWWQAYDSQFTKLTARWTFLTWPRSCLPGTRICLQAGVPLKLFCLAPFLNC